MVFSVVQTTFHDMPLGDLNKLVNMPCQYNCFILSEKTAKSGICYNLTLCLLDALVKSMLVLEWPMIMSCCPCYCLSINALTCSYDLL